MGREDLAGVESDDRDLVLIGDGEDAPAGMGGPDLEVVQPTGPAQGDPAVGVGQVVAETEVVGSAGPGGHRLRGRRVRLGRSDPSGRPVRPELVVLESEGVELGLELGEGAPGRPAPEPALEGLVEALDLALQSGDARAPRSSGGCRGRRARTRTRSGRR